MVEHRLAKARVASSNLVSRSNPPFGASRSHYAEWNQTAARLHQRRPCQGAVPKW